MVDISVIIPCYNVADYVEVCIKALSSQTFKNFETILVDDCSGDNTIEVLDKLVKKYNLNARIIKNDVNVGPSHSRKNGIHASSAEYIAFCDSDDYYDRTFLEKMYEATEGKKNDVVFCDYNAVYSNGTVKPHNNVKKLKKKEKKQIIAEAPDSLCCMLVRKRLVSDLLFPEIRNGEDMAIIPVIVSNADYIGGIEECIYNYVYRDNSLSKKFTTSMITSLQTSFLYIMKELPNEFYEEVEFLGIKNYLYAATLNLFKSEKYPSKNQINATVEFFTKKYVDWNSNNYLCSLPKHKRIYLFAVKYRLYYICRILSTIHRIISK